MCFDADRTDTPGAVVIVSATAAATGLACGRLAILDGPASNKCIDGGGKERSAEERKTFFRGDIVNVR